MSPKWLSAHLFLAPFMALWIGGVAPRAAKLLILLSVDGADFLVAFLSPSWLAGIVLTGPKVTP
jgi:hypothetical protein